MTRKEPCSRLLRKGIQIIVIIVAEGIAATGSSFLWLSWCCRTRSERIILPCTLEVIYVCRLRMSPLSVEVSCLRCLVTVQYVDSFSLVSNFFLLGIWKFQFVAFYWAQEQSQKCTKKIKQTLCVLCVLESQRSISLSIKWAVSQWLTYRLCTLNPAVLMCL